MSCRNVLTLLDCLSTSYETAKQFDQRPGMSIYRFMIDYSMFSEIDLYTYLNGYNLKRVKYDHVLTRMTQ